MLRYEVSAVQASARALVRVGHPPDISQPERDWLVLITPRARPMITQGPAPLLLQPAPLLKGQLLLLKSKTVFLFTTVTRDGFD